MPRSRLCREPDHLECVGAVVAEIEPRHPVTGPVSDTSRQSGEPEQLDDREREDHATDADQGVARAS